MDGAAQKAAGNWQQGKGKYCSNAVITFCSFQTSAMDKRERPKCAQAAQNKLNGTLFFINFILEARPENSVKI